MAVILRPSSGELSFQSDFTELAFVLFRDPVATQSQMFNELSRYGLRPGDVRYDTGGGALGDVVWTYQFTNLRFTLRLRLDKIDLNCYDLNNLLDNSNNVESLKAVAMSVFNL